jgi:hypothetical protein
LAKPVSTTSVITTTRHRQYVVYNVVGLDCQMYAVLVTIFVTICRELLAHTLVLRWKVQEPNGYGLARRMRAPSRSSIFLTIGEVRYASTKRLYSH